MFIERPPKLHRLLLPGAVWRMDNASRKSVYLTFDDGPVPEVTPQVLDILDRHNVKATFFVVGDNVRKHPELFEQIKKNGHSFGNHTMHHLQGLKNSCDFYLADIEEAGKLIGSSLFRPPHGLMKRCQNKRLKERYTIVMHDVLTRDYGKRVTPRIVIENVKRFTRPGSIIVFHDSEKARRNILASLEESILWLKHNGYELLPIPMPSNS